MSSTTWGVRAQRLAVQPDLAPQPIVHGLRVRRVERNQEREHAGALDVLQKPKAETLAGVRALDDAGNVGDDEGAMIGQSDDAEVGLERGERIVGDLGAGRRHDREERALAGVGLAHEPHVGDELEHQLEAPLLTLLARLPLARRLVGGRGESRVPAAAPAAARNQQPVSGGQHLPEHRAGCGVLDDRSRRHRQLDVVGAGARLRLALPMLAPLRLPARAVAVIEQRGEVGVRAHVHAAPAPAVTAVRPALGLVLESGERAGARAAGAGGHLTIA